MQQARLSELARPVRQQHERITLTHNGEPEAVWLSVDDLEGLEMTLESSGTRTLPRASRRSWQLSDAVSLAPTSPRLGRTWPIAASQVRDGQLVRMSRMTKLTPGRSRMKP